MVMIGIMAADWMLQRFAPGVFWLAPAAVIGAMVADRQGNRNLGIVIAAAVVTDLFSGVPFGWVTGGCLAVFGVAILLRRWVRMSGSHVLFFMTQMGFLLILFAFVLAYPLGVATILERLPFFLIQSLAPLIMIGMIKRPSSPRIYETPKLHGTAKP